MLKLQYCHLRHRLPGVIRMLVHTQIGTLDTGIEGLCDRFRLKEGPPVYPFVATCGREIEQWSRRYSDDLLRMYWADAIMEYAAEQARELLRDKFRREMALALSEYSPGSLPEFPITGQQPLFQLLGDAVDEIGVVLNDSLLMLPVKSVSGILFYGEQTFHSCQMCPRLDCPKRRTD